MTRVFLLFFVVQIFVIEAKEDCDVNEFIQKVADWTKSLPILVKQDESRLSNLKNYDYIHDVNLLRDTYYKTVSQTQQTSCTFLKRFSGRWIKECGFLDGEKIVCMDNLYEDVKLGKCLIYSFGLADDWDFEEALANLGCTVRAFDPNVEEIVKHPNIHFKKLGLSDKNGTLKNTAADGKVRQMPVLTLLDSIKLFGDENKEITYLKIDVEGAEFGALPEMLNSGVFHQIRQMGIEMHTGSRNLPKEKNILKALNNCMSVFKELQETYGFRNIAYNANGCMAKKYCLTRSYHNYHDIVFYKP